MIAGYHRGVGSDDNYWFCKVGGADRKYIRMMAGLALPILDRVSGAVVIVGEVYRQIEAADIWGIAATCGEWPAVENALGQYRRDLKFDHIIVDVEQAREVLWRLPVLNYGLSEIPLVTYTAPKHACTEVGRSRVDEMIREGRLHVDEISGPMNLEPEQAARALQSVICYMQDNRAYYKPRRKNQGSGRILGVEGL